jgi:hypothetical protein
VQREGAGGVVETNMFSNMKQVFGDLKYDENYLGMVVCFSETNFFKLTGLDKKLLFERKICDYFTFFQNVMDLYAKHQERQYWVQKSSVENFKELYEAFPNAKFIIIEREIVDNVRSTIGLYKLRGDTPPNIVKAATKWYLDHKILSNYYGKANVTYATFDTLKNRRLKLAHNLCDFIGLQFDENMLKDRFDKNSSFQKGIKKEKTLSLKDEWIIKLLKPFLQIIPCCLLKVIQKLRRKNIPMRRFVIKSFSMLKKEYGWRDEQ